MTRLLLAIADAVGRRGLALAVIGLIWLFYGLGMIVGDPVSVVGGGAVWHLRFDPDVRGALQAVTGLLAIYTAASRPRSDTPGFLALSIAPMVYVASYLTAWVVWALPLAEPGYAPGLVSALSWGSILALIALVASWPEPERATLPVLGPPPGSACD